MTIIYKGFQIEFIGGTWTPYRIDIAGEKPRFFSNLHEAQAFISWWLDDV